MTEHNEVIMNIGIDKNNRKVVVDALMRVLADSFILSLKTRNYHWNVTGPAFAQLHALFETIYGTLDETGDTIAERIRALGHRSPGSYVEFISMSVIKEEMDSPDHTDMIHSLVLDVEHLMRRIDEVKDVAMMGKDDATADMMIEQLRSLGKFAWMLRSHLEA